MVKCIQFFLLDTHAKYRQIYFTLTENGYIWQIFLIYIDMYLLYIYQIYIFENKKGKLFEK